MTHNPYRLLSRATVYQNPWIHVREDHVVLPDGGKAMFGVVEGKPGSSVLAVDDDAHVYLVREYKYGVGRECLEVVSGGIEQDEPPADAARRELLEEAGISARRIVDLGYVDPFTAVVKSPNYMFLAFDLEHGDHERDPGELIEVVRMPFDEALERTLSGEVTHSTSAVLILKAAILARQAGGILGLRQ
jgi:ADP-ribose pyrophosphatase